MICIDLPINLGKGAKTLCSKCGAIFKYGLKICPVCGKNPLFTSLDVNWNRM